MVRPQQGPSIALACAKDDLATAEAARPQLSAVREELAGPHPSAVERMLADRAALCRLDCYLADTLDIKSTGGTIWQAELSLRRRDYAGRRYVSALKALAAVRKLSIVAVQVNLGTGAAPGPRVELCERRVTRAVGLVSAWPRASNGP